MTHDIGMIRYLAFRDSGGSIRSVAGVFRLGDEITAPIVGYDTDAPAKLGLYRLAMYACLEHANKFGFRVHQSSGAAAFKRNRGARPEIEYTAFHVGHLPSWRKMPVRGLQAILNTIAVPIMRRYEL
jgi:hypothetical protein